MKNMLSYSQIIGAIFICLGCSFAPSEEFEIEPGYYLVDTYSQFRLGKNGDYESRNYLNHFYGSSRPEESEPQYNAIGKWRIRSGMFQVNIDSQRIYNDPPSIDNPNPKIGWSDWFATQGDFAKGEEIIDASSVSFQTESCIWGINFEDKTQCYSATFSRNAKDEFVIPPNCIKDCGFDQ